MRSSIIFGYDNTSFHIDLVLALVASEPCGIKLLRFGPYFSELNPIEDA